MPCNFSVAARKGAANQKIWSRKNNTCHNSNVYMRLPLSNPLIYVIFASIGIFVWILSNLKAQKMRHILNWLQFDLSKCISLHFIFPNKKSLMVFHASPNIVFFVWLFSPFAKSFKYINPTVKVIQISSFQYLILHKLISTTFKGSLCASICLCWFLGTTIKKSTQFSSIFLILKSLYCCLDIQGRRKVLVGPG